MSEFLEVQFHFPYDKVTVEKMSDDAFGRAQAAVYDGRVFEVKMVDFLGKETGAVEVINPAMLTHIRVSPWKPF